MPAEAPLTLTWARVVRPPDVVDVPQWARAAEAEYGTAEVSPDRTTAEFLYSQLGLDAKELCERAAAHAPEGRRFRISRSATQAELTQQAVLALAEALPLKDMVARCGLVVCSASSLDSSSVFHSMIGGVTGAVGLSKVPYFSVAQLQGASLAGAIDIVDAMLTKPGSGALFLAVERWPVAFPRYWEPAVPLGDGAVAFWLTRGEGPGLRYVGGAVRSFDPFVRETPVEVRPIPPIQMPGLPVLQAPAREPGRAAPTPTFDTEAMLDAATSVLRDFLQEQDVSGKDLSGWVASGLRPDVDQRLRERLGIEAPVIAPPEDDGYWCAAAAPALLARLVDGAQSPGGLFLSWGMSYGGSVGTQLWRAVSATEGQG
ncbi:hypothetical protein LZ198_28815 [Myxococcus sp. K15C18031901]|uniref:hypothetical protein n=1 Tax=Myxococcus dinghuensis TaxID=2906761 RepID=UPI0020A7F092|nr:hypothetical protein [Myxococcus dinghuensis]MCP3102886.1 hypothetical protein [Myxococcus dinghuensis]